MFQIPTFNSTIWCDLCFYGEGIFPGGTRGWIVNWWYFRRSKSGNSKPRQSSVFLLPFLIVWLSASPYFLLDLSFVSFCSWSVHILCVQSSYMRLPPSDVRSTGPIIEPCPPSVQYPIYADQEQFHAASQTRTLPEGSPQYRIPVHIGLCQSCSRLYSGLEVSRFEANHV